MKHFATAPIRLRLVMDEDQINGPQARSLRLWLADKRYGPPVRHCAGVGPVTTNSPPTETHNGTS